MTEIRIVAGVGVRQIELHGEPRVARTSGGKVILSWGYASGANVELTMDEGMRARIVGREHECECSLKLERCEEKIEDLEEELDELSERSEPLVLFA